MTRAQRRGHLVVWLVIVPLALIVLLWARTARRPSTAERPLATTGDGR